MLACYQGAASNLPRRLKMLPLRTLMVLPHLLAPAAATYVNDANISAAVAAWRADPAAAETSYGHIGTWDTSDVTTMAELFLDCGTNEDISAWNTAQVTSMYGMFWRATYFNQPIGEWDVSKVTDMSSMFREASSFNQLLNGWTTTSLASTSFMFSYAEAFNQPLDQWDTSALTAMNSMFECAQAFDQNIGWGVSADCLTSLAFFNTECSSWDCGLNGATPPPSPLPTTSSPSASPYPTASASLYPTNKPPPYPEASGAAVATPLLFLGVVATLLC